MKRRAHWGQDSPIVQLRVILGAIEGELRNIQEGIASDKAPARAIAMTLDAQDIASDINRGHSPEKWDEG